MLSLFPFSSMFISSLMISSLAAISSNNWLFIWMGLEINLLSFIPLLFMSQMNQETEAAMKYFLIQSTASGILLLGASGIMFNLFLFSGPKFSSFMLIIALATKLGMAPCHFWFPSVMSSLSWPMCFILSTWQKLVPLFLILMLLAPKTNFYMLMLISLSSSIIGGMGGMNQSQLRPLLAYSSIGHMSWVVTTSLFSTSISMMYFTIYVMIILSMMSTLLLLSMQSNPHSINMSKINPLISMSLMVSILSLGGLPPLTGFMPKWFAIQLLLMNQNFLITLLLVLGSLMNLFYYLNIFFSMKLATSQTLNLHNVNKMKPLILIPLLSSTMTLPILMII
uniref:NADH dehydrogenase subunit 2 n=1 Tax=Glyphohesione klatti TaxID=3053539 RepID=UPI0030E00F39